MGIVQAFLHIIPSAAGYVLTEMPQASSGTQSQEDVTKLLFGWGHGDESALECWLLSCIKNLGSLVLYGAVDVRLDHIVALKFLPEDF